MKAMNTELWKEEPVNTEQIMTEICLEVMCGGTGCACITGVMGCPLVP